jgi:WD40 repeat protein
MLRQKISEYEKTIEFLRENFTPRELKQLTKKSYEFTSSLVTSIKLSEQGECRVLAHSDHLSLLVIKNLLLLVSLRSLFMRLTECFEFQLATQSSMNPALFPGYGIRKINTYDMKPQIYIKLHDKVIRDVSFGPHERSNLLSVSLDCNAKLFDVQSNTVVQTFKGESETCHH